MFEFRLPRIMLDNAFVSVLEVDTAAVSNHWLLESVLSDSERARMSRFVRRADRRLFTIAHAALRIVLGELVECCPRSLCFVANRRGKPALSGRFGESVTFNLAHSGGLVAIAFGLGREVGIDIEQERSLDLLEIAQRFFAPAEANELSALAPDERQQAFFRCWTRKEALVKAHGGGLFVPLNSFAVTVRASHESHVVTSGLGDQHMSVWQVCSIPTVPGFAAAVAAEGKRWKVAKAGHIPDGTYPTV